MLHIMLRRFCRMRGLCLLPLFFVLAFCIPQNNNRSVRTCENLNLIPGNYDFAGLSSNDKVLSILLYTRCIHERENKWCTPLGDEPVVAFRCKRSRRPGSPAF